MERTNYNGYGQRQQYSNYGNNHSNRNAKPKRYNAYHDSDSQRPYDQESRHSHRHHDNQEVRRDHHNQRRYGQQHNPEGNNQSHGAYKKPPSQGMGYNQHGGRFAANQSTGNFGARPQHSGTNQRHFNGGGRNQTQHASSRAVVHANSPLHLVSNQFKISFSKPIPVYMYRMEIQPMPIFDADLYHKVLRYKQKHLQTLLGEHVCSGQNIWMFNELEESIRIQVTYKGQNLQLIVDVDTLTQTTFGDHSSLLLNVAIKQAFRETSNLKQIGKSPRFFDISQPLKVGDLEIWSGFKASAVQTDMGCNLVIDNCFKFMSTRTCLDRMAELKRKCHNEHKFSQLVKLEFCNKSIIAGWGNKRTYIVHDVDFSCNPFSKVFMMGDREVTVAEYFLATYQKTIREKNQPMFVIKQGDQDMYLPPELCMLDGVPASMKKSREMCDAMAAVRISPKEKLDRINQMCSELFSKKAIEQWGINIEQVPIEMQSNVLTPPQIFRDNQIIHCDENVMRRLQIQKPKDLLQDEWILVYQHSDRGFSTYDQADRIFNTFQSSCKQLGIRVEEPCFIEMEREDCREELQERLASYMLGSKGRFRHPTVVVCLLANEHNYSMYKQVLQEFRMPSQMITLRNARSFNASKASNILRQINSKAGGDLYTMKFPDALNDKRTMLIGIDVCHAGPQSIVGFSASTNREMSQYYSDYLIQRKGQEIVGDKMKLLIKEAIQVFSENHNRELPTNFIIFRDGVSTEMRDQVLAREIPQFEEAIRELQNAARDRVEITVVVVNKRITQRFFVKDSNGRLTNPPSGCIVDKQLVEFSGTNSDERFDFYLTPSNTTQGCVLPTHFFVPKNSSSLKKVDIQHLTYALCHFYFNWAGPIKVPAPCQYAHKIAEFYMNIGANRRNAAPRAGPSQVCRAVEERVMPLNRKLHFL